MVAACGRSETAPHRKALEGRQILIRLSLREAQPSRLVVFYPEDGALVPIEVSRRPTAAAAKGEVSAELAGGRLFVATPLQLGGPFAPARPAGGARSTARLEMDKLANEGQLLVVKAVERLEPCERN